MANAELGLSAPRVACRSAAATGSHHRTVAVVCAGLSRRSTTRALADQLAEATGRALGERGSAVTVRVVELREHARELVDCLLTRVAGGDLRNAVEAVAGADALIAATPIFNASYSGLFKTFFDVLDADALVGRPVLIAATGGTARHALALEYAIRPLFAYLRSVVVPTAVYASPGDRDAAGAAELAARVDRAARELAALTGPGTPVELDCNASRPTEHPQWTMSGSERQLPA